MRSLLAVLLLSTAALAADAGVKPKEAPADAPAEWSAKTPVVLLGLWTLDVPATLAREPGFARLPELQKAEALVSVQKMMGTLTYSFAADGAVTVAQGDAEQTQRFTYGQGKDGWIWLRTKAEAGAPDGVLRARVVAGHLEVADLSGGVMVLKRP
ncbi:MAG: hypothetical protein KC583_08980 [Myxococcales bacterium]|nr:hypothetical protein [Myxococcales bacterium]